MEIKHIETEWLDSYNAVCEYIKEHNCTVCDIPKTVTDKNGEILRYWVYRQIRYHYEYGEQQLSDEQKELLSHIGIQKCLKAKDRKWYAYLEEVAKFYETHHHFIIPDDYLCEDGTKLFLWVVRQKAAHVKGILNEAYLQAIVERGLIGMMDSRTEVAIRHLEIFYQQNGHSNVPADYVCDDGLRLGRAVRTLRTQKHKGELTDDIVDRLDALGMIWDKYDHTWNESFEICKAYYEQHGNLDFTEDLTAQEIKQLKAWLQNNRFKYLHGELSKERTGLLYSIGALDVDLFPKRQKRTGQPENQAKLRKDRTLRVRMTEDEFDSLVTKAKSNGYDSLSEYVRNIIL